MAMPLSAFAIVEDYYVAFGAMTTSSSFDDVCKELITLASNAYDALEAIEEYLI